jgi:hypothetical protein
VGNADALCADTTRLAQVLHARGLAVIFAVHPGGHNRAYWRTQTAVYLQFYLNSFSTERSSFQWQPIDSESTRRRSTIARCA